MPLYEFHCHTCGDFETWRGMAEATAPMPCPECQIPAKRLFSAPNISLNSGRVAKQMQEPRLVQGDRQPPTPRYSSQNGGRPWMISH